MKLRIGNLVAVLALALAPAASATTFMMVSDSALADRAAAVAEVRVVAVEPSPAGGRPATDYLVEVERVVKGYLTGSTVVVRVPGGVRPDGLGLKIWGAPQFAEGERALLFLTPNDDGTYRTVHLMLGAFHERVRDGRKVVIRDLSEAREVVRKPSGGSELRESGADVPRDLEGFSRWLQDRASGVERPADYVVVPRAGALGQAIAPFTFLASDDDGKPIRWFRFDGGGTVSWRVHQSGQPGLGLDRSTAAFRTALEAWNADSGTDIRYAYAGTTTANGGLHRDDDVNTILFDDPTRDDVDGTFSCGSGGVIAAGGPFFFISTRSFRGAIYHETVEADIVTNDGTECFFRDDPRVAEEVFAHELGHTLGLGHSRERDALMWATAHDDGRGARLSADDRAAVAALYGNGSNPPTGGPAAPTNLAAQGPSTTQVTLTWRDNASDEDGYLVERKRIGGTFRQVLALPANTTTATVTGLASGQTYAFRVRAKKGTAFSAYSNVVKPPARPVETTAPQAPSNLRATVLSRTQVRLNWRDNSTNEARFAIQKSTAGGPFTLVATVPANAVQATIGGLSPGTTYTFRIRATNGVGASAYTPRVTVRTAP